MQLQTTMLKNDIVRMNRKIGEGRESADGLRTGFFARHLRKNKARDSRAESPSNPGIGEHDPESGNRFSEKTMLRQKITTRPVQRSWIGLWIAERTAMMDRALTLALTVAVVANTLCLWSYL